MSENFLRWLVGPMAAYVGCMALLIFALTIRAAVHTGDFVMPFLLAPCFLFPAAFFIFMGHAIMRGKMS